MGIVQSVLSASSSTASFVIFITSNFLHHRTARCVPVPDTHTHTRIPAESTAAPSQRWSGNMPLPCRLLPRTEAYSHVHVSSTCAVGLMKSCLISRAALHTAACTSCKPVGTNHHVKVKPWNWSEHIVFYVFILLRTGVEPEMKGWNAKCVGNLMCANILTHLRGIC